MAHYNEYTIGQLVRLDATFRDNDDALADPDQVSFQIKKPDSDPEPLTGERDSLGVYYATVQVDTAGIWYYRVAGDGAVTAAAEHYFRVLPSQF